MFKCFPGFGLAPIRRAAASHPPPPAQPQRAHDRRANRHFHSSQSHPVLDDPCYCRCFEATSASVNCSLTKAPNVVQHSRVECDAPHRARASHRHSPLHGLLPRVNNWCGGKQVADRCRILWVHLDPPTQQHLLVFIKPGGKLSISRLLQLRDLCSRELRFTRRCPSQQLLRAAR
jgi:hypothetical protein